MLDKKEEKRLNRLWARIKAQEPGVMQDLGITPNMGMEEAENIAIGKHFCAQVFDVLSLNEVITNLCCKRANLYSTDADFIGLHSHRVACPCGMGCTKLQDPDHIRV